jgi:hypothetical protein
MLWLRTGWVLGFDSDFSFLPAKCGHDFITPFALLPVAILAQTHLQVAVES